MQKEWSDNSVSCTVYYNKEDIPGIKGYLARHFKDEMKTVSFLLQTGDKNGNLSNNYEWINLYSKLPQIAVISQACWSSVSRLPAGSFIYIDNYKTEKTKDNIKSLIDLINEITPCSIVKIKDKDYIEYKLFAHLDS